jgi:formate-dependent nitrite reductase membrane component NrfD
MNDSMVFQVVLLLLFLVLAGLLLTLPDRHFRTGSRKLRIVGAVAFVVAAVGALVNIVAG